MAYRDYNKEAMDFLKNLLDDNKAYIKDTKRQSQLKKL